MNWSAAVLPQWLRWSSFARVIAGLVFDRQLAGGNPVTAGPLRRYGRRLLPFVLMEIGLSILVEVERLHFSFCSAEER